MKQINFFAGGLSTTTNGYTTQKSPSVIEEVDARWFEKTSLVLPALFLPNPDFYRSYWERTFYPTYNENVLRDYEAGDEIVLAVLPPRHFFEGIVAETSSAIATAQTTMMQSLYPGAVPATDWGASKGVTYEISIQVMEGVLNPETGEITHDPAATPALTMVMPGLEVIPADKHEEYIAMLDPQPRVTGSGLYLRQNQYLKVVLKVLTAPMDPFTILDIQTALAIKVLGRSTQNGNFPR